MGIYDQLSPQGPSSDSLSSYVSTMGYASVGYALLSRSFDYIAKNKALAKKLHEAKKPNYSKYVPLYEGYVGVDSALSVDQVLNYHRAKGYFRQKTTKYEPSSTGHRTIFDSNPDAPVSDLADSLSRNAPDDSLVNVQRASFGILGGNDGSFTVGVLSDDDLGKAKYVFGDFREYADFLNDISNIDKFGNESFNSSETLSPEQKNAKFVREYLDKMTDTRGASYRAREAFNQKYPGVLAVLNEININPDVAKNLPGGHNRVRVSQVIEKNDKFLVSLVSFNSDKFGDSPEFIASTKETIEQVSRGNISRRFISISKADINNNVRFNGTIYQPTPELMNMGKGVYGVKNFELQLWEVMMGKPSATTSLGKTHELAITRLVEEQKYSLLDAVHKHINGLQYGLLSESRVDVPGHGMRANAREFSTLGQDAKVAQTGDTNRRAFLTQNMEAKRVVVLAPPQVGSGANNGTLYSNTSMPLGVDVEDGAIKVPGYKVVGYKRLVSQGEGSVNVRGLLDWYNYGLHNAASSSNAGRVANVFMRGSSFESILPKWKSTDELVSLGIAGKTNLVHNLYNKDMYSNGRIIFGTHGNMTKAQYNDLRKQNFERRAGIISNYMFVSESELSAGLGLTEGASAVVRRSTIPGVLPEHERTGAVHQETVKLSIRSSTGEIPKSTLNALHKLTYVYHGDINKAKAELGADTIIGYDYKNPDRKITLGDFADDIKTAHINYSAIDSFGYIGVTVHRPVNIQQEKDTFKNTVSHFVTPERASTLFRKKLPAFVRNQYERMAKSVIHVASFQESITKAEGRIAIGLVGDILSQSIDVAAKSLNRVKFDKSGISFTETNKTIDQSMQEYLDSMLTKINGIADAEKRARLTELAYEEVKKYRYEYDMVVRKRILDAANARGDTHRVFANLLGITEREARDAIESFEYGLNNETIVAILKPEGLQNKAYQVANYRFETTVKNALGSRDAAAELIHQLNSAQEAVDHLLGNVIKSGRYSRSKGIKELYKIYRDLGAEENNQASLAEKSIRVSMVFRGGELKGMNIVHNALGNIHKASDAPTSFAHSASPGINGYVGGAKITYEGMRNSVVYGTPSIQNYFHSMLTHNTQYVADKVNILDIIKNSKGNTLKYAMGMKKLAGQWVYAQDIRKFEIQDMPHFADAIKMLSDQSHVIEAFDKLASEKIITGSDNLTLSGKMIFAELLGIDKDPTKIDIGDIMEALRSKGQEFAVASEIADNLQMAMSGKELPMIKLPEEVAKEIGQSHIPLMRIAKEQKFKFDSVVHLINEPNKARSFTTGDGAVQANFRVLKKYAQHKALLDEYIRLKATDKVAAERNRKAAISLMRDALKEYNMEIKALLSGKGSVAASSVGNFRLPFSGNGRIKASNRIGFNEVGILKDRFLMMVSHGNISDFEELIKYDKFRSRATEIFDNIKFSRTAFDKIAAFKSASSITDKSAGEIVESFGKISQSIKTMRDIFGNNDFVFAGVNINDVLSKLEDGIKSSVTAEHATMNERANAISKAIHTMQSTWNSSIEILPDKIRIAELARVAVDEAQKGIFFTRIQGYPEINSTSGKFARVKLLDYNSEEMYGKAFSRLIDDNQKTLGMSRDKAIAAAKKFVLDGIPNFVLNNASAKSISRDFDGDALSFILTSMDHIAESARKHGTIYNEILKSVSQVKQRDTIGIHIESIIEHLSDSAVIKRTLEDKKTGKKHNGYFPASSSSLKAINAVEKSNVVSMDLKRNMADVVDDLVTKTLESQGVSKGSVDYIKTKRELVSFVTNRLSKRVSPYVTDTFADSSSKEVVDNILSNVYYLETKARNKTVQEHSGSVVKASDMFTDLDSADKDMMQKLYNTIRMKSADDAHDLLRNKSAVDAARFNLIKGATPTVTSLGESITNALIQNVENQDALAQFVTLVATESLQQKTISSKKGTPYIESYRSIFKKIANPNHVFTESEVKDFINSDYEIFMDQKTREMMKKYGFTKNGETHVEESIVKYSEYEAFTEKKLEALKTVKAAYESHLEKQQLAMFEADKDKFRSGNITDTDMRKIQRAAFENAKESLRDSDNPFIKNLAGIGINNGTSIRTLESHIDMVAGDLDKIRKFKHGPELQSFIKKLSQTGKYSGMKEEDIFNSFVKQMRPYLATYNGSIDTLYRHAMKDVFRSADGRTPDLGEILGNMKDSLIADPKHPNVYHISSDNLSYRRDLPLLAEMEGVTIHVHAPDSDYYKQMVEKNIRADRRNMREYARAAIEHESTTMRSRGIGEILSGKEMRVNVSAAADDIEKAMRSHSTLANIFAVGAGLLGGMYFQQKVNGYAVPDIKMTEGRGGQYYDRTENIKTHIFGAEAEVFSKKKPIKLVNTMDERKKQGRLDSYIRNKAIAERIASRDGAGSKRLDSRYAGVII